MPIQAALRAIKRKRMGEAADPVKLARRAGMEPDSWQAELLRSNAQQMILLCSRQKASQP